MHLRRPAEEGRRQAVERNEEINSRDEKVPDTLNPEFYKRYDLKARLPGTSSLEVSVYDHDYLSYGKG